MVSVVMVTGACDKNYNTAATTARRAFFSRAM